MPFCLPDQLGWSLNLQITAESMKSISGELRFASVPQNLSTFFERISNVAFLVSALGASALFITCIIIAVCRFWRLKLDKLVQKILTLCTPPDPLPPNQLPSPFNQSDVACCLEQTARGAVDALTFHSGVFYCTAVLCPFIF